MERKSFTPQSVDLANVAKNYVPKAIWQANKKHRLYAISPECHGKVFVATGPTAIGSICTQVLAADLVGEIASIKPDSAEQNQNVYELRVKTG